MTDHAHKIRQRVIRGNRIDWPEALGHAFKIVATLAFVGLLATWYDGLEEARNNETQLIRCLNYQPVVMTEVTEVWR